MVHESEHGIAQARPIIKAMGQRFHETAFTPSVKQVQDRYGTRKSYLRSESGPDRSFLIGDAETDFIEQRDGFYLGTVSETGQPYVQYRGGRPGFLKVLDERTLGYADFRGNLQYISIGNLSANKRASLFLMDYANRRRLKIFAELDVYEAADRPDLAELLIDPDYEAKVERVILLNVTGFDWNCPQHITPRYTMGEIGEMLRPIREHVEKLERKIREMEAETV